MLTDNRFDPLPSNPDPGRLMRDLVESMAKAVVSVPDAVTVEAIEEEEAITFKVNVASEDTGRIIGKQGRVANAMRTILRAVAGKEGQRVFLKIGSTHGDEYNRATF
jgi:predicted RNA-binding protein YlqC (UPF0109 family)